MSYSHYCDSPECYVLVDVRGDLCDKCKELEANSIKIRDLESDLATLPEVTHWLPIPQPPKEVE